MILQLGPSCHPEWHLVLGILVKFNCCIRSLFEIRVKSLWTQVLAGLLIYVLSLLWTHDHLLISERLVRFLNFFKKKLWVMFICLFTCLVMGFFVAVHLFYPIFAWAMAFFFKSCCWCFYIFFNFVFLLKSFLILRFEIWAYLSPFYSLHICKWFLRACSIFIFRLVSFPWTLYSFFHLTTLRIFLSVLLSLCYLVMLICILINFECYSHFPCNILCFL